MSGLPAPCYRFATPAQWGRASIAGIAETLNIDIDTGTDDGGIAACKVGEMVLSPYGDMFWVGDGRLFAAGRVAPHAGIEGPALGAVRRLVAGRRRVWALAVCGARGEGHRRLIQVDAASLQVLIDVAADGVDDIAADGRDGLWLLAGGTLRRLAANGAESGTVPIPDRSVSAIARAGGRLALLAQEGRRILLLDPQSGDTMSVNLSRIAASGWIGAEARLAGAGESLLVQGAAENYSGGKRIAEPRFLLIGAGGDLLATGSWQGNRAPDLLCASDKDLFGLTDRSGEKRILRFGGAALGGGERRLTPALETHSPAVRWLRAEVKASLPERATLTLRWAASADQSLRRDVERILGDAAIPAASRLEQVDLLLEGRWSGEFTYAGGPADGPAAPERLAFPLHEADGPILWVDLKLRRNSADASPRIESLLLLHEAESLMDDLPAIYSGDGDRDGTMRRLVAILETTTQGIDCRIGALARRLDPKRTSARWLPGLAAMLGLPFHEALDGRMQRRLVEAAPSILAWRGTRRGLVAMFAALFPGRPVRVLDRTEQLVPIALGRGAAGRSLPGLLSGPSIRAPRLNARLVLGKTGLCPTNACADLLVAPPPQVLVAIPASREERRRFGHAVAAMVEAMIPAGVRLRLNWIPANPIEPPELLGLGDGPSLGRARIGGRAAARLDGSGTITAGHRLL